MTKSTGDSVWQQLEDTVEKTGVPREILSDHGPELHAGIRQCCDAHPETCSISDITHKVANVLKHTLEADEEWHRFTTLAVQSKSQIQPTALAYLSAPKQHSKARFMNVGKLVTWGWNLVSVFEQTADNTTPEETQEQQQMTAKLGWILAFRASLETW